MPKVPPRKQSVEPAPSSPVVPTGWAERKILCEMLLDGKRVDEPTIAHCRGPLAVHKIIDKGTEDVNRWVITSIPTKLKIVSVHKELDAYRIAEILLQRCRMALQKSDRLDCRDAMPSWGVPWLRQCQREFRYVPPPFEQADE